MIISIKDIIWGIVLTLWVAFVTLYISKLISKKFGVYVTRKVIHMLGGGVVAALSPIVFNSPIVPIITSYLLMLYLILIRIRRREMRWFMEKENLGEIYFTFSFGTILLIMFILDHNYWQNNSVYIAILPLLFMSFGDGITGIIRNAVYKRRVKGLWGSLGMLVFCSVLGYLVFGIIGIIAGVIATIMEIVPIVDDNISVPFASFIFLYLFIKII
ncbi:phosphatidate cytidylyltransferase [Sulfolobus sp. A20]|uniref:phosphatidate cytidylyltransferase n=1 Tax=Sulfolobaceae TaxID=118883 RepID=UPI00084613E4|nr:MULTISPECIES: phosphatidate cytidylyltransferase [unclassified Sulfolobus]TRM76894.1 phosphatidate cytidylyltransferase [Sulfolobus sp. B5]TRM77363.1 phosphatidate cytidylyltransferase [Sulfolobus sp. A20-N-F8]TRM85251.1 phosphatidate cytidylyltransferase [Sulfolobus sp. F3]TRM94580.1 phosphatidate cytidylyltransferase [Sulfolobus sp. A20-N-G8]TRN00655.1 phosphatidate cytidylyltransferase [Sulfolobus sp. F1]TRN04216.1 phosphatidate cytidylyltransferase [Sulfolobus sp. E1]